MPQTNDHVILSSAADGKIFYTNIGQGSSVVTQYQYHCHVGAAYQVSIHSTSVSYVWGGLSTVVLHIGVGVVAYLPLKIYLDLLTPELC